MQIDTKKYLGKSAIPGMSRDTMSCEIDGTGEHEIHADLYS
jgi:hypothetical protein